MKNKIVYIVMIIVIILGVIMIKSKNFNYETLYSEHKRIEIVLGNGFDVNDVSSMASETIKEKSIVRRTTLFGTSISIDAKDITDDEAKNLFSKLNEKYGKDFDIKDLKKEQILVEQNATSISDMSDEEINSLITKVKDMYGLEYTKEELQDTTSLVRIYDIGKVSIYDTLKGFIAPFITCLAIIFIYFSIRFRKLYKSAWILEPMKFLFKMFLSQGFILAVIAIARIPVSQYIPALLIFVWLLQIIAETVKNEKKIENIKEN